MQPWRNDNLYNMSHNRYNISMSCTGSKMHQIMAETVWLERSKKRELCPKLSIFLPMVRFSLFKEILHILMHKKSTSLSDKTGKHWYQLSIVWCQVCCWGLLREKRVSKSWSVAFKSINSIFLYEMSNVKSSWYFLRYLPSNCT